jgi:hypothetical protein
MVRWSKHEICEFEVISLPHRENLSTKALGMLFSINLFVFFLHYFLKNVAILFLLLELAYTS